MTNGLATAIAREKLYPAFKDHVSLGYMDSRLPGGWQFRLFPYQFHQITRDNQLSNSSVNGNT
jgi:hypothetical protein